LVGFKGEADLLSVMIIHVAGGLLAQ